VDQDLRDECVALSLLRLRRALGIVWREMTWPVVDYGAWTHSVDARRPYNRDRRAPRGER
jgi:hypothetical protein